MTADDIKQLQEIKEGMERASKTVTACPNCGYCQHCGRGGNTITYRPYPLLPGTATPPQWSWTWTTC